MSSLPVLDELPAGYFVEETPKGILVLHADATRALHEAGYGPEEDGDLVPSELSGRRPLFQFKAGTPSEAAEFLVRRFTHGGLMRWLTGDRFLDPERPFRELVLSDSLLKVGIQTPRVIAARARRLTGGWQLDVMTRRIADTVDLGWVLAALRRGELAPGSRHRILEALGSLVRKLHLHGCPHADLQPGNVLANRACLEGAAPQLWILDLDRSVRRADLSEGERHANMSRLYRHVARRDEQLGASITRADVARFFRGYDPDGETWRRDWRAVRGRHALGLSFHRLGWFLERLFGGPRKDPRSDVRGLLTPPRR